ncbi:MAG: DUF2974 domain-containing protein [Treponema sp.]|nr:DUF2974 domain-containing protein [Treponema sp.]
MANLIEYVKWRGDITFNERPFNILDNLVLCHIGYLNMIRPLYNRDSLTVREIWEAVGYNAEFMLVSKSKKDSDFLEVCANTERFGNVVVSDYVDDTNIKENKQFAAMTFHTDAKDNIVVFRGTDNTIVGWKEDFMMSYCKIPAQEMALEYIQKIVRKYESIYVCGHSKGGNLALFSVAHLNQVEFGKIKKVYLNDSPGFCNDVLDTGLINQVDSKCVRITPEYCIVGAIFEPNISESYIVKSSEVQMLQHGVLSWQVDENGLQTIEKHDATSEYINELFDKFIEKMENLDDRQAFVNSIFDTMGEGGAVTIDDFMKKGPRAFENLLITVIGDNEDGLNPLKSVKDNVFADLKSTPIAKVIDEQSDKKSIYRVLVGLVVGILCFVIPGALIETSFAIGMFLVIAYQISITIHRLMKCKWDLNKERVRVTISIALVAAYAVLIVKDDALFLFSSVLFGIFFLANAYQSMISFKATKDKLSRTRHVFEALLTFIFGGYLIVGPDVGITWYTMSCGAFFFLDAVFELIHIYRVNHRDGGSRSKK